MGLEASLVAKSFDNSNMTFSNQLDPIYGDIYQSGYGREETEKIIYPDFATGALIRYNLPKNNFGKPMATITAGMGFHHITQPNESFLNINSPLPMKTVAHINAIIPVHYHFRDHFILAPAFIYEQQASLQHFTFGTNLVIKPVIAGLWYRNSNFDNYHKSFGNMIFTGGINIFDDREKKLQITYSYDFNTSKLQASTGLAHEINIRLVFKDLELFPDRRPSLKQRARSNKACYNEF